MKSIVYLNNYNNTSFETEYSAAAIEQCFDNDGYCVVENLDKTKSFMLTPKSILYVETIY